MPDTATTPNLGICGKCHARVPASHSIRDGQVFLVKSCPQCGSTEGLVSTDAAAWQRKRDIWQYNPATATAKICHLHCETCHHPRVPRMVFVDLTNRCNMNCPICIANIPWMGFEFHPPMAYFEKVLRGLAALDPKPVVHLFGGEPTVRSDMFEIVDLARSLGLRVHLVTNGIKLADEDYCRKVCERKIPVFLGFDGRSPEIYARMRRSTNSYEKKMKALENLQRFSQQRQDVIMCCTARKINEDRIADLFQMCFEHRNHIKGLNFLPLTETWESGRFEADISTTIEDVQEIVDNAFPDEKVEFVSLGLQHHFDQALSFLRSGSAQTFPKVHPNCEAATVFLNDGQRYRPLSHYLKRPLEDLAAEAVVIAKRIEPRLRKLDPRKPFQRLRGKLIVLRAYFPFLRRNVRGSRLTKGNPWLTVPRILAGLLLGRTLGQQLAKHTVLNDRLTSIILPFEETHSVESQRMEMCGAAFAFEDPLTGEIKTYPVCVWGLYKDPILKALAEKYGAAKTDAPQPAVQES